MVAAGTLARMGSPTSPLSPILSPGHLQALAAVGEERTAAEGEFLFRIGDSRYPFIVVLEGEAAVLDGAGNEIARQGPGGFLAEMNLLTGQTVYVDAVVTEPMRYIAVDRDDLKPLLFEDAARVRPLVTRPFSFAECLHTPPMLLRYSGESDAFDVAPIA